MPKEKALFFRELIFKKLKINECLCFTNWFKNPWTSKKGASWNPITENTFDIAVVLVDTKRIVFTYFISED